MPSEQIGLTAAPQRLEFGRKMGQSPSQLRMGFTRFEQLAEPEPVPGYGLSNYCCGDEDAWVAVLSTGEFGEWDRDRLERMIGGERAPMPLEGVFFATYAGCPVGSACAFLYQGDEGEISEFGWLAVCPSHRGHGLGLQMTRAVLGYVRRIGHKYTFLKTEGFRLPAIKTYLRAGFEPEVADPTHAERWESLYQRLGLRSR